MKKIRKLISVLLVGMMFFSEISPLVFALEKNQVDIVPVSNSLETEVNEKGTLEVEVHLLLPIRNNGKADIALKLKDKNGNFIRVGIKDILKAQDGYLTVDNLKLGTDDISYTASKRDKDGHLLSGIDYKNNVVYFAVNFAGLSKGNYELEFSGKNFVSYTQKITIDNYSKRVNITNEKGMFEIGDINSDNVVDDKDITEMLKAIHKKDLDKDLNLDGLVDIADLNYITAVVKGNKKDAKVEDTNYIFDSSSLTIEDSSPISSGNLTDIFKDEGIVTLKPENGPISKENPVKVQMELGNNNEPVKLNEIRLTSGTANNITGAYAEVETEDGKEIFDGKVKTYPQGIHLFTDKAEEGTIIIDLGKQIAVKKVTIFVTETSSKNLADIAKVEFLNNVKVETKEPEGFYTPKNIQVDSSVSEQLTVSFNSVPNVTGYEIKINGPEKNNVIFQTTFTTFTIEDLKNYKPYTIQVQSVNDEWRSGWSEEITASPEATRRPPAVDMVVATPTYGGIDFSWKDMDDTKSYNLYYRELGTTDYISVKNITGTKYNLRNLKSQTTYEAYLTGNNDLGEGSASKVVKTTTLEYKAVIYPKYKLINNYDGALNRTNHINEVRYTMGNSYLTDGNNNITESDKWSMVDDNYLSYWEHNDWQINASGGYNINAPLFVLDKVYKMDEFVITVPSSYKNSYKPGSYNDATTDNNDTLVYYWKDGDSQTKDNKIAVRGVLTQKKDKNNQVYYVLKLQEPIETQYIQFGLTVVGNGKPIQIAEVKFYEYDSLVDDVAKLFVDDLRVELAAGVNQKKIDELRERANTKNNGEYNPYRESILNDLEYAEKILNDKDIANDVITMNSDISNTYDSLGFAMTINDYQPLGIAVRAGEQLTVYVGSTGNVNADIVFTQVHAEANAWSSSVKLNKGQNIITVPTIGSASTERGGSVYVRFNSKPSAPIKIRVSGGVKIPVLDTTLLKSEQDKKDAIKKYITELRNYVSGLPSKYEEIYQDVEDENKYTYNEKESAFGVTEIATKYGLLSFSSKAVLDAIDSGLNTEEEKINRLYESTEAFDEMMLLFYRHKGLELNSTDKNNKVPSSRINIRYMTMFDGAFMYAGGYHIGIEYGSIAGVIQGKKNTSSATGYFGWGISHEIGHQINQANLVHAEVTNNVYALLAQTANDKDKSRLESSGIYEKIYEKVTSHTLGKPQNVFVTLGMYWQLHLAYDDKNTFDDTNSIFARINKLSRSYKNENKYTKDELLILFASMAAEKDLTEYFEIWGLTASDKLKEEIASHNLEKETKAIYYLNDEARRYRLSGKDGISNSDILTASIKNKDDKTKRVTLEFNVSSEKDKILGYEIIRNGESIAFATNNEYTDVVGAVNNQAFAYEVVAYDYLLNKTNTVKLEEIKISHDGSVKKDNFSIESNFKEPNEVVDFEDDTLDYNSLKVNNLIDDNYSTGFNGTSRVQNLNSAAVPSMSKDNSDAYVIINLNTKLSLSGIKYTPIVKEDGSLDTNTIKKYKIEVSSDKEHWTTARSGEFSFDKNASTVYFMKPGTDSETQLYTFDDISYVRITSVGNKTGISGLEFDIIAPPGDNIDIENIGKLSEDYCYLTNGCPETDKEENGDVKGIIKKGSVIIQGTYAGSPSFNTVVIEDVSGNLYKGYQLLFAEVNSDMTVYEVATGTWIYVLPEDVYAEMVGKKIRAYLYRSNDAETFEGSRITSTSLATKELGSYDALKEATISGN